MMGNVDTFQKSVTECRPVRGPDSGPGLYFLFNIFYYAFYGALHTYQHAQIDSKLDSFKTFKQLQAAKCKVC